MESHAWVGGSSICLYSKRDKARASGAGGSHTMPRAIDGRQIESERKNPQVVGKGIRKEEGGRHRWQRDLKRLPVQYEYHLGLTVSWWRALHSRHATIRKRHVAIQVVPSAEGPEEGLVGMTGEKGLEAVDIHRGSDSEQIRMVKDGL